MGRYSFFIIFWLFVFSYGYGQELDRTIVFKLIDKTTGLVMDYNYDSSLKFSLCTLDGDTIVKECLWHDPQTFGFNVAKEGGKFRMKIDIEGYTPYEDVVNIRSFKNVESIRYLDNITLTRKPREQQLGTVVVKASKIKFYYRGDTLVYNADAFETPEGSMLNDLVSMLPGVELKQGGEIFVNGKKIDALLLNGERIFNNNNVVLLENLPNYMVKDVRIYDKESDMSHFANRKMDVGEYVMDVKLKKQYCKGLIGNIEAGYGSMERYLMRMFGLRFTDSSRLTFYANINNLNDNRNPGESDQWTPEIMPKGKVARKKAGFNYLVKGREERWTTEGGVDGMLSTSDNYQRTTFEQLLPAGTLYTKSLAQSKSKYNSINTYHTFKFSQIRKYYISFNPTASYSESSNNGMFASATFNIDPLTVCKDGIIDSIKQLSGSGLLRNYALNRVLSDSKNKQTDYSVGLKSSMGITQSVNTIFLDAEIKYKGANKRAFRQTLYDYPSGGAPADFRNQYDRTKPNSSFLLAGKASYDIPLDIISTLGLNYDFTRLEEKLDFEHQLLNKLEGWDTMGEHPLGILPSESDYLLTTIDAENSYNKHEIKNTHKFGLSYGRWPHNTERDFNIQVKASLSLVHDRMNYYRGNGFDKVVYSGITRKNFVLQNYSLRVDFPKGNGHKSHPILYYNVIQTAPSLISMLDGFNNTLDPHNISTGNKDLKVTTEHRVEFEWRRVWRAKHQTSLYVKPQWVYLVNALAYGSTYDIKTGIRHYKPENVNGNYNLGYSGTFNTQFGAKNKWSLELSSSTTYMHGVDLVSTEGEPSRSIVNTVWNKESAKLTRSIGKHRIGVKGTFGCSNSSSERENFSSFTLYDFNYGATALLRLPWKMSLTTDLTMYSRRGYADSSANTNDLVWNARLSKTFTKSGITVMLDGFDILNQLNNITQTVNSQGRTETYFNALPSYVMAHVIYRLNKKPKKK